MIKFAIDSPFGVDTVKEPNRILRWLYIYCDKCNSRTEFKITSEEFYKINSHSGQEIIKKICDMLGFGYVPAKHQMNDRHFCSKCYKNL